MTYEYSEDNLIEQTAIDLFHNQFDYGKAITCIKQSGHNKILINNN